MRRYFKSQMFPLFQEKKKKRKLTTLDIVTLQKKKKKKIGKGGQRFKPFVF